jgi:plasmid stabilization system protein ParE
MIDRVVYTPEADDDVAESYNWYESREPGLGEDFLRCIEACVLAVQRHPQLYPIAIDDFRHAPIRRFPFEIFYEPGDNCITIYAVFHCSQDPRKWRERLEQEEERNG